MGSEVETVWLPRLGTRLERLLQAAGVYVYTVYYENGGVAATKHSRGCQAVTGYKQEDYDRDPTLWIKMVHPEDRDDVCRQIIAGEHCRKATRIEHRVIHHDGSVRWLRNTIIPCLNGEQLVCCDGLIEDVTDRKRAEQTLRRQTMQLTAAQEIQRRLLPQRTPSISGTEVGGVLVPADYAAGDFYDYLTMPDGSPAFVIGDVSGHGFGPALLMSLTHTLVRILTEIENDITRILAQVNDFLVKETQDDRFVTLFYARYDAEKRTICYASAGHPPAYVMDCKGNVKTRLVSTCLPLGVLPNVSFPAVANVQLERGDLLLMLTDGVLETFDSGRSLFGEARMLESLRRHRELPPERILATLHDELREFSGESLLRDDVTAVILKVL